MDTVGVFVSSDGRLAGSPFEILHLDFGRDQELQKTVTDSGLQATVSIMIPEALQFWRGQ